MRLEHLPGYIANSQARSLAGEGVTVISLLVQGFVNFRLYRRG